MRLWVQLVSINGPAHLNLGQLHPGQPGCGQVSISFAGPQKGVGFMCFM